MKFLLKYFDILQNMDVDVTKVGFYNNSLETTAFSQKNRKTQMIILKHSTEKHDVFLFPTTIEMGKYVQLAVCMGIYFAKQINFVFKYTT